jgi:hypothetical protein
MVDPTLLTLTRHDYAMIYICFIFEKYLYRQQKPYRPDTRPLYMNVIQQQAHVRLILLYPMWAQLHTYAAQ